MPAHASPSPGGPPPKRARQAPHNATSPSDASHADLESTANSSSVTASSKVGGQSSTFRNVSACNRCRLRKNRCDQKLPSCASCAKAGVACVGYDPITKKEIPRSYVFYLETRVKQLENLLSTNGLEFPAADDLELCSRPSTSTPKPGMVGAAGEVADRQVDGDRKRDADTAKRSRDGNPNSVASKSKSLASTTGVSFARVVLAAVQHSRPDGYASGDKSASRNTGGGSTSMRDSFFGLHTKPTIKPAPFPSKEAATPLVTLYFEHANPQIPILHRPDFMQMFERAYAKGEASLGPRDLYMLNMVFAIGSGVIMEETIKEEAAEDPKSALARSHSQPEEYHASAIIHLESCLSSSGGGLEVLQAVLLLANMALLRPVPPGLWYIIGVAVRLAVDLGLHHEDSVEDNDDLPSGLSDDQAVETRGRRSWLRDMKRRLWWCTYSFDRLVGMCVGRPFGISDQVITTEFPSLLDDEQITMDGLQDTLEPLPSYKHVAHHYFRLRLLQSEMIQVLQYNQAQVARANHPEPLYPEMHDNLPCPFLAPYRSFREWRMHVDLRLEEWKDSAPTSTETGVAFSTEFLELNYWQAIVMLYRQSLSVPPMFRGEYNVANEVNSPATHTAEAREDEEAIYDRVAEAGQKILKIYRQLHLSGLISHTYLTTHHLFMAGVSFLYAIWHSPTVRSRLTMDEVDHSILSAYSVFTALISKCPPAEPCRDAFDRTAKATIKMAKQTGGFGSETRKPRPQRSRALSYTTGTASAARSQKQRHHQLDPISGAFEVSPSGNLSSPGASPLARRSGPDTDGYTTQNQSGGNPTPVDAAISPQIPIPPVDPSLSASPNLHQRVNSTTSTSSYFAHQQQHQQQPPPQQGQFTLQSPTEFPDMPFLQGFEGSNGEDQGQLNLGFGMDWEGGSYQDFEGGQMNPFDSFFFGGQQGGNGGGGEGGP